MNDVASRRLRRRKIKGMVAAGRSVQTIANQIGLSRARVYKILEREAGKAGRPAIPLAPGTLVAQMAIAIRKCRCARGWTQAELAERCDRSRSYVYAVERQKYVPNLSVTRQIAKALRVPLSVILSRECRAVKGMAEMCRQTGWDLRELRDTLAAERK